MENKTKSKFITNEDNEMIEDVNEIEIIVRNGGKIIIEIIVRNKASQL